MWPSEETAGTVFDVANIVLIVALAVGAAATAAVVWMGNVKENYSKNALAAAESELERLKTPRSLNEAQQHVVRDAVAAYPGTKFDLVVQASDPEAAALCSTIEDALIAGGWTPVSWAGAGDIVISRPGKATIGQISIEGLAIQTHLATGPTVDAASALAHALEASGITPKVFSGSSTNVDGVHVIVGKKPMQ